MPILTMLKSYRENVGKLEKSISTNKKVLEKNTEKHDELKKILEDEKARENERKTLSEKAVGLKNERLHSMMIRKKQKTKKINFLN